MFSKLRYPKTLVDSTINKFSQEPDKEIHTVPSVDPSVYIVLPFIVRSLSVSFVTGPIQAPIFVCTLFSM